MAIKPPDSYLPAGDNLSESSRKPLLMRKPRGSRRSNASGHTLYTITSCSEGTMSQTDRSEERSSKVFTRPDTISKPTNFATIVTDTKSEQLPPITGQSQYRQSSGTRQNQNLKSRATYLPNIQMGSMAKKNWINAEVKTFNMWHVLSKAKTETRNSLPTQEMIKIEEMLEEMRRTRRTDPSAMNFSAFADVVRQENNQKHERHLLSNPRYNTSLSLNKF